MWKAVKAFRQSDRQTKFFIFTILLYFIAIIWTTIQSYARLEYSRSDRETTPIIIQSEE